mmetsp:Transcript_24187/g.35461  ORF Transcript_24187/g.35461 Transcript_24187/m.35461 type:complete len:274 (+) Transcript_24187:70-891(+)
MTLCCRHTLPDSNQPQGMQTKDALNAAPTFKHSHYASALRLRLVLRRLESSFLASCPGETERDLDLETDLEARRRLSPALGDLDALLLFASLPFPFILPLRDLLRLRESDLSRREDPPRRSLLPLLLSLLRLLRWRSLDLLLLLPRPRSANLTRTYDRSKGFLNSVSSNLRTACSISSSLLNSTTPSPFLSTSAYITSPALRMKSLRSCQLADRGRRVTITRHSLRRPPPRPRFSRRESPRSEPRLPLEYSTRRRLPSKSYPSLPRIASSASS